VVGHVSHTCKRKEQWLAGARSYHKVSDVASPNTQHRGCGRACDPGHLSIVGQSVAGTQIWCPIQTDLAVTC
jgi:hypothetical protein